MNILEEKSLVLQMKCGDNFSYILEDNTIFSATEYKVLQNQPDCCFIKCMKMFFNGKIQLYYFSEKFNDFSLMLNSLDSERLLIIIKNLFADIIEIKNNGFLNCRNIDLSFDKIFIDKNTYKVSLTYLPLSTHIFNDVSSFENDLRTSLIKLIQGNSRFLSAKTESLLNDLQNGSLSIDDIYRKLGGKRIAERNNISIEKSENKTGCIGIVSVSKSNYFDVEINKNSFTLGKKETNDGVISFNKMISRNHCRITKVNQEFFITDLKSANGTYVNNYRLQPNQPFQIKVGDVIRLADSNFKVTEK